MCKLFSHFKNKLSDKKKIKTDDYRRSQISSTNIYDKKKNVDMFPVKLMDPEVFWVKSDLIGYGSFGKIYKCISILNKKIAAMKVLDINEHLNINQLLVELEILKKCNHKNIVQFYDAFMHNEKIFIIMEYCALGSLETIINDLNRNLTEDEIRCIVKQVLEALFYLHQNLYVIHRDIKAANILVSQDGKIKLADFGVSAKNQYFEQKKSTFTGSHYWVSPEVINCSSRKFMKYNYKADIWSLGITCIELAEKQPPNSSLNPKEAMKKIKNENSPELSNPSKWSTNFKDFVNQCLLKNSKERPSAIQLLEVIFSRHVFILFEVIFLAFVFKKF